MDASEESILARLAQHRAELRDAVADVDRAIAKGQQAKREALEALAEVEAILGARGLTAAASKIDDLAVTTPAAGSG